MDTEKTQPIKELPYRFYEQETIIKELNKELDAKSKAIDDQLKWAVEELAILKPNDIIEIQYPNKSIPKERLLIIKAVFKYSDYIKKYDIIYYYRKYNKDGKIVNKFKTWGLHHSTLINSEYQILT